MWSARLLWMFTLSSLHVAQSEQTAPLVLAPDSSQVHLIHSTPPIYPAIARIAHIEGVVTVQIVIGPEGRIISAKILSGPDMLRWPTKDALRHWVYTPVVVEGKPVAVTTTAAVPFYLKAPASQYAQALPTDAQDRKLDARMEWLEADCTHSLESSKAEAAKQVQLCRKAAEFSEQYSEDGYAARCRTYTYLAKALLHNKQLADALAAADRAIAAAQNGFEEGPRVSAAYSVRSEIEVQSGKFTQALEDLTVAEDNERDAITHISAVSNDKELNKRMQSYAKFQYAPVLKSLLTYHAQILTKLSRSSEALIKQQEADRL